MSRKYHKRVGGKNKTADRIVGLKPLTEGQKQLVRKERNKFWQRNQG